MKRDVTRFTDGARGHAHAAMTKAERKASARKGDGQMGEEAGSVTLSCVYCGVRDATTIDDIPPRCLFGRPLPATLIKVPSCFPCNNGASKDDEYFRNVLSFRHDVEHPDAEVAREAALRSLVRPEAPGLRAAFLRSASDMELRTPAGLYLGHAGAYTVDTRRVDRVVQRIVMGLLYGEAGRPLPSSYATTAYGLTKIRAAADNVLGLIIGTVLQEAPLRFIGPRTVGYRILHASDDTNASACLVTFYERVTWLGLTATRNQLPPRAGTV
jgi:hypothetical protein